LNNQNSGRNILNNWDFQQDNKNINMSSDSFNNPMQNSEPEITVPNRIKLELRTPLEQFWIGLLLLSGIATVFGLIDYFGDGGNTSKHIASIAGLIFVVAGVCYRNTDNYYILDGEKKCLMYRFKFFSSESLSIFAHFSKIHAVTVKGVKKSSKHSTWWEYQAVIVLDSGKVIPVSDMEREAFHKQDSKAKKFATITGAKLVKSFPEHTVKPTRGLDGKYTFTVKPYSILDALSGFGLILVFVFIFAVLVPLLLRHF
jgi:hypothetical protein